MSGQDDDRGESELTPEQRLKELSRRLAAEEEKNERAERLHGGVERTVISEDDEARKPRRGGRIAALLVAVLALGGFGGIVWYAYTWGVGAVEPEALPLVGAPEGEEKVKPEDPGGLEVPHQDSVVLNETEDAPGEGVEHLLPPPEEPQPLPEPEETTADAQESGTATEIDDAVEQVAEIPTPPAPETKPEPEPQVTSPEPEPEPDAEPAASSEEDASQSSQTQVAQVGQVSGHRIQLSALRSQDQAKAAWADFQKSYPDLLGSLELHIEEVSIEGQGTFFRVQAEPFPSRSTAADVCEQLQSRGQGCFVIAP